MDLFEAIDRRYSYRGEYTSDGVSRQDLEKIVQAGIQAPSGCNAQSTTFVVVDEPEICSQLAEVIDNIVARQAKAFVVCVIDPEPVYQGKSFELEDCAAAVENMLLAVAALGYATVWLDGVLQSDNRAGRIGRLLGVPQNKVVKVVLPLGVAKDPGGPAPKKDFNERAWFNKYGG